MRALLYTRRHLENLSILSLLRSPGVAGLDTLVIKRGLARSHATKHIHPLMKWVVQTSLLCVTLPTILILPTLPLSIRSEPIGRSLAPEAGSIHRHFFRLPTVNPLPRQLPIEAALLAPTILLLNETPSTPASLWSVS